MTIKIQGDKITFPDDTEQTTAYDGSSGGGGYTPEKFVWEDVSAERALDTIYTNTQDVPIYVQAYFSGTSAGANNVRCLMDGADIGYVGNNSTTGGSTYLQMPMFIVPAGSTYKFEMNGGTSAVYYWHEARMPVAVGTGGKTVAFRGNISSNQTITTNTWAKVNLNNASINTDSALADGKFQPSVAGYYQINGAVAQLCTPNATQTSVSIKKNGSFEATTGGTSTPNSSFSNNVNDVIYLNGTTDYLELFAYIVASGTCAIKSTFTDTFLSAVLVSGGSASGGSVWTEPNDSTARFTSGDDTVSVAQVMSGTSNSKIVQYATGQSYYQGFGPTYFGNTTDADVNLTRNNIVTLTATADGITTTGNVKLKESIFSTEDNINLSPNNVANLRLSSDGTVNFANLPTSSAVGNVYISGGGFLYKSTATLYSAEEVDKRLAIKDKLIEKLSARLDKLEKRIK